MELSFIAPSLTLDVELPPDWAEWFGKAARVFETGVAMEGPPADYGLVWEYGFSPTRDGTIRQYQQGPRTVWSENALGEPHWMSSQAPHGWIAVNEPRMREAIMRRLADADLNDVERACVDASIDMFNILQETVPMDSGDLSNSLALVPPRDSLLDEGEESDADTDWLGLHT